MKRWVLVGAMAAGAYLVPGLAAAQNTSTNDNSAVQQQDSASTQSSTQSTQTRTRTHDDSAAGASDTSGVSPDMSGTGGSGNADDSSVSNPNVGSDINANPDLDRGNSGTDVNGQSTSGGMDSTSSGTSR